MNGPWNGRYIYKSRPYYYELLHHLIEINKESLETIHVDGIGGRTFHRNTRKDLINIKCFLLQYFWYDNKIIYCKTHQDIIIL